MTTYTVTIRRRDGPGVHAVSLDVTATNVPQALRRAEEMLGCVELVELAQTAIERHQEVTRG